MIKYIKLTLYKDKKISKEYHNIKAIINNNNYLFKIDNIKTSLNPKKFTRENKEYIFNLDIENNSSTIYLKDKKVNFDIEVEKVLFKQDKNKIILEYKLSSDESNFKIIIEGEKNE